MYEQPFKVVRDKAGWTSTVIMERQDGVIVDWDYVEPKTMRFIPHGKYEIVPDAKIYR
jgi:hypothetical protein